MARYKVTFCKGIRHCEKCGTEIQKHPKEGWEAYSKKRFCSFSCSAQRPRKVWGLNPSSERKSRASRRAYAGRRVIESNRKLKGCRYPFIESGLRETANMITQMDRDIERHKADIDASRAERIRIETNLDLIAGQDSALVASFKEWLFS